MAAAPPRAMRRVRRLPPWLPGVLLLAAVLALTACGASGPPRVYAPLRYDYLTLLRLNVASVTVEQRFVPGGANDLNGQDPAPLVPTLTAMAQDRLQAAGSSGRAVFVIKDASLVRTADGIAGSMDVELDVYSDGGTRAGFAEARVVRRQSGTIDDLRSALYDMTRQLMDAMNIEFEYQVVHSLKDWLAPSGAAPAPVQQQALPPPPGAVQAPPSPNPLPAPMPAPTAPPVPNTLTAPSTLPAPQPYPAPALAPPLGSRPGSGLGPLPTPLAPPQQP